MYLQIIKIAGFLTPAFFKIQKIRRVTDYEKKSSNNFVYYANYWSNWKWCDTW